MSGPSRRLDAYNYAVKAAEHALETNSTDAALDYITIAASFLREKTSPAEPPGGARAAGAAATESAQPLATPANIRVLLNVLETAIEHLSPGGYVTTTFRRIRSSLFGHGQDTDKLGEYTALKSAIEKMLKPHPAGRPRITMLQTIPSSANISTYNSLRADSMRSIAHEQQSGSVKKAHSVARVAAGGQSLDPCPEGEGANNSVKSDVSTAQKKSSEKSRSDGPSSSRACTIM